MKFAVIAPMYWDTEEHAKQKCWLYLRSCAWAGVTANMLRPYGMGAMQYPGSRRMRLTGQLEWLKVLRGSGEGFTHVLYSDAWDVIFVQPFSVMLAKYVRMGCPPLVMGAAPRECGHWLDLHPPESDKYRHLFDAKLEYGMPSGVFEVGELGYIIDRLSWIDPMEEHNISRPILNAYLDGTLTTSMLDTGCEIFQERGFHMEMRDGQMYNPRTGSYPCMAHFSNGNPLPDCGQDKLMEPWAQRLGII